MSSHSVSSHSLAVTYDAQKAQKPKTLKVSSVDRVEQWRCEAYGGARELGRPPRTALCKGRHLRGENLEFWHLHCNVLE